MPCFTIKTVGVDIDVADRDRLVQSLQDMGASLHGERNGVIYASYRGTGMEIHKNKVVVREGSEGVVTTLKQAYAKRTIEHDARKNGWLQSTWVKDKNGDMQIKLRR